MIRICIVNPLLCDLNFFVDFSEQRTSSLFDYIDFIAFDESTCLFEVCLTHYQEAACGTGFPSRVLLDFYGQLF